MEKTGIIVFILFVVFALVFFFDYGWFNQEGNKKDQELFKVAANVLNIRSEAGQEYGVIGSVVKDNVVGVSEKKGEWAKIKVYLDDKNFIEGYVSIKYLIPYEVENKGEKNDRLLVDYNEFNDDIKTSVSETVNNIAGQEKEVTILDSKESNNIEMAEEKNIMPQSDSLTQNNQELTEEVAEASKTENQIIKPPLAFVIQKPFHWIIFIALIALNLIGLALFITKKVF